MEVALAADERQQRMAKQWDERTGGPYVPSGVAAGQHVDASERVAQALEYIAAQAFHMNAKLDEIIVELAKARGGSP